MKKEIISFTLPPEVIKSLKAEAKKQNRSVSNMVTVLLEKKLK
jgi:hypothetical protein